MTDRDSLKRIETRIAMIVSDVDGIVTGEEIDIRDNLRVIVGERYDAINGAWLPLDTDEA